MFGFVQLIPQLIINYKLKSVAHMPYVFFFLSFFLAISFLPVDSFFLLLLFDFADWIHVSRMKAMMYKTCKLLYVEIEQNVWELMSI